MCSQLFCALEHFPENTSIGDVNFGMLLHSLQDFANLSFKYTAHNFSFMHAFVHYFGFFSMFRFVAVISFPNNLGFNGLCFVNSFNNGTPNVL